jgi:hypothetical protein
MNLLDVFNETWTHEAKPFKYNKINFRKKNEESLESEAKRYTSPNPIKLTRNGQTRYNIRKLNKVLELSLKIQNTVLRSKLLIEKIFLSFDFLYGLFQRYFNAIDYTLSINYIEELNEFLKKPANTNMDYTIPISILIQLICMYNMNSLNGYPESIGLQLTSRLLGLYGISDFITKFIDECDVKSLKNCALVPAYQCEPLNNIRTRVLHNFFRPIKANQYLKMDGLTPDFFLCSKSIFIWVWSPEQGVKSSIIGEIALPDVSNGDFNLMKIYNTYSSDKYEILIANLKYVICIEESGKEKWMLSLVTNGDQIKNISLIGDRAFMITYENQSYIDLYNLANRMLIERKEFGSKVLFLKTNRSQKLAWDKTRYNLNFYVSIGLDNSTLVIYKVTCDYKTIGNSNIIFEEVYKRVFTSYTLISGLFELFKAKSASYNKNFQFRFIATFNNMKCVLVELEIGGNLVVKGIKALYSNLDLKENLTLLSFKQNTVTMQYGKTLHLYFIRNCQWYTVPGVYSYVSLNTMDNYTIICGIYQNVLNVFLIQTNQKNYKMLQLVRSLHLSDEIFDAGIISSEIIFFTGHFPSTNGIS